MNICAITDCHKPTRTGKATLCKMHYHRQYRHGDPNRVATHIKTGPGRRYLKSNQPDHPTAMPNGQVYVHRAVLYDTIGPGPHPCHWCNKPIDWLPKGHPDELQPDHLNGIGDDNRPDNLVPSCRNCNSTRGVQARAAALRAAGWWSHHDTVAITSGRRPPIEANA